MQLLFGPLASLPLGSAHGLPSFVPAVLSGDAGRRSQPALFPVIFLWRRRSRPLHCLSFIPGDENLAQPATLIHFTSTSVTSSALRTSPTLVFVTPPLRHMALPSTRRPPLAVQDSATLGIRLWLGTVARLPRRASERQPRPPPAAAHVLYGNIPMIQVTGRRTAREASQIAPAAFQSKSGTSFPRLLNYCNEIRVHRALPSDPASLPSAASRPPAAICSSFRIIATGSGVCNTCVGHCTTSLSRHLRHRYTMMDSTDAWEDNPHSISNAEWSKLSSDFQNVRPLFPCLSPHRVPCSPYDDILALLRFLASNPSLSFLSLFSPLSFPSFPFYLPSSPLSFTPSILLLLLYLANLLD